jgi:hypothetical protein
MRDPHPFARGGSVAICTVSLMHVVQSLMISVWPASGNATPLRALLYVSEGFGIDSDWVVVTLLILSALLGLTGALLRLGYIRLMMFVPQHFFLGVMAIGGLYAAWEGQYLDGTVMPWSHILSDQMPVTVLFLVHSSAILRRARDPNG